MPLPSRVIFPRAWSPAESFPVIFPRAWSPAESFPDACFQRLLHCAYSLLGSLLSAMAERPLQLPGCQCPTPGPSHTPQLRPFMRSWAGPAKRAHHSHPKSQADGQGRPWGWAEWAAAQGPRSYGAPKYILNISIYCVMNI
jgi:hypothetical protein